MDRLCAGRIAATFTGMTRKPVEFPSSRSLPSGGGGSSLYKKEILASHCLYILLVAARLDLHTGFFLTALVCTVQN